MRDTNVTALPVAQRLAFSRRWLLAVLLVLSCGLWAEGVAWSQQHDAPRPASPQFGQGRPPAPKTTPKVQVKVPPSKAAVELKIDSVTLPPDYVPPAEKDPLLEIDQPITLPEELANLKKDINKYTSAMNKADYNSDAGKALIRNGIRYRLALMCLKENRKEVSALRTKFANEVNSAGDAVANVLKAAQMEQFRTFVMQEVVNQSAPLLKNNLVVRIQITILLGELDVVKENPSKGIKAVAFTPAQVPLRDILTAPTVADPAQPQITYQPETIKILAVNGLTRILKHGTPDVTARTKLAEILISQLANKQAHPWYQMRLAQALSFIDGVILDQAKKPFVVDALKAVVNDAERKWSVRAEAASSLGRVPLPAATNPSSVVLTVAKFAEELAKAAQQAPADPHWKNLFWKVYLAFRPLNANDLNADKKTPAGLLNSAGGAAKPAYDKIVPLVRAILNGQKLTAEQLQQLGAWIKDNTPAGEQHPDPPTNKGAANPPISGGP